MMLADEVMVVLNDDDDDENAKIKRNQRKLPKFHRYRKQRASSEDDDDSLIKFKHFNPLSQLLILLPPLQSRYHYCFLFFYFIKYIAEQYNLSCVLELLLKHDE